MPKFIRALCGIAEKQREAARKRDKKRLLKLQKQRKSLEVQAIRKKKLMSERARIAKAKSVIAQERGQRYSSMTSGFKTVRKYAKRMADAQEKKKKRDGLYFGY